MASGTPLTDKQLEILHDHYKETFERLQRIEANRDRLFIWLIGLFALLCIEIGYPTAIGGVGTISIVGGEFNPQSLPLPALLSCTWSLTVVFGLRYCQMTILVQRQYPYLHSLEEAISPTLGGGDIYQREGKVYLRDYPLLLNVAWIAYGFLFPLIVMIAAVGLLIFELYELQYPLPHRVLDGVLAVSLVVFFFVYRIQPTIAYGLRRFNTWRKSRKLEPSLTPPI